MIAVARAELGRMLRRRGLIITAVAIPAAVVVVNAIIKMVLHTRSPEEYPIVGGSSMLADGVLVTFVLLILATLIGATLGAEDTANGTLRYILLTGFSRIRLYLVRLPIVTIVGILVSLPALLLLIIAAVVLPHEGAPSISASDLWQTFLSFAATTTVYGLIAYGIGTAIRSTGGAIAVALGLNIVGLNLVGLITLWQPSVEDWMLPVALARVTEGGDTSIGVALLALLIWCGAFLVVGLARALRTEA